MNKVKAIVLFSNAWRMKDEKTGIVREGNVVDYVMSDNLGSIVNQDGSKGYRIIRENININNVNKLVKVPGIYEMEYGCSVWKGRPVMKLQDIKFVSEV